MQREIVEYAKNYAKEYGKGEIGKYKLQTIASCLKLSLPMETIAAVTGLIQEELDKRLSELALSGSLVS